MQEKTKTKEVEKPKNQSPETEDKVLEPKIEPMALTDGEKTNILLELVNNGVATSPEVTIIKGFIVRFKTHTGKEIQEIEARLDKIKEKSLQYFLNEVTILNLAYGLLEMKGRKIGGDLDVRCDVITNEAGILINIIGDKYTSFREAVEILVKKKDILKN